ncbi:MAG: methanogenesis marker 2 protein [Euryarchaeota archaeon]|nr:methanogenesis marker 2 protein [Euryarchaeota archaeon]
MNLDALVKDIRNHPGVTRKAAISDVISFFPNVSANTVLASYGEDAAVVAHNDSVLLLAADGIMESLLKVNPFIAGYYAVLVNLNDIVAMGGIPLAMVDIISMKDERVCAQVMRGVEAAVSKFGVPIVGGHTHPDCEYDAIDIAILGTAGKDEVIYSHTARIGDDVIMAMDLEGYFPPSLPYAWDTTYQKDSDICRKQLMVMNEIGRKKLANSGKDISNPGCVGTLGMLLETSGKGATVDIAKIPMPDGVDLSQWIRAYQGCGFVITCLPENSQAIIDLFSDVKVDASVVGKVNDSKKLTLHMNNENAELFDFTVDKITGCDPSKVPSLIR